MLIRDDRNIIVIENKIKSDINTIATDGDDHTQLDRYVNYVEWRTTKDNSSDKNKTPHYFILAPNYNKPKETKVGLYKTITYGNLYNFLKITSAIKEDPNFKAFFEAMHRHTHENVNDYLYYDMLEKFVRRIKEANNSK